MRIEMPYPNTATVTGYAMTQYGDWKVFTANIHRLNVNKITKSLEDMADGKDAMVELGNVDMGAIYVARLPPGIGLIDGRPTIWRPGQPDLLLYCSQVVDSIADAIRMLA